MCARELSFGKASSSLARCLRAGALLVAAAGFFALPTADAGTLADGDFSGWSFSGANNGSMTLEPSGGNPGVRLNATTFPGSAVSQAYAINGNFSTSAPLFGAFTLELQVLTGAGSFSGGQRIGLLVQQGSDLYLEQIGNTGTNLFTFQTLSFFGTFDASRFIHVGGSGADTPNFGGGTVTLFGFVAYENPSATGTITQYYDNFALTHPAVPEPSTWILLAGGGGLLALAGRKARRA